MEGSKRVCLGKLLQDAGKGRKVAANRATRGVVERILDTVKVSDENRSSGGVQVRTEVVEESVSVMGKGMEVKKRKAPTLTS